MTLGPTLLIEYYNSNWQIDRVFLTGNKILMDHILSDVLEWVKYGRLATDMSTATMETQRQRHGKFKVLRENKNKNSI